MATKDKPPAKPKKDTSSSSMFDAVSKAVQPLSGHLQSIERNTKAIMNNTKGGGGPKGAEAKFENKNMFSRMFAGIKSAIGGIKLGEKKEETKGIFGWIKDNWGKLLAGVLALAPLFIPLDKLVRLWNEWMPGIKEAVSSIGSLIMEHPIMAGISAALLFLAGPSGIFVGMGAVLKGGLALAKFAAGAAGPLAIVAAIAKTIYDGIMGAELAGEWGVGKTAGVMGAILGGTGKGVKNAFKQAGVWAVAGAAAGSFVPIVGTLLGGIIGAAVGGVLGWIGGEKIAQMIQTGMNKLGELWDGMIEGLKLMVEDFNVYLIQPVKDFGIKIFDWISNISLGKAFDSIKDNLATMVDDFNIYLIDPLINFFGKLKDWASNAITSMLPEKILDFFGMGKKKPAAAVAGPSGGITQEEADTAKKSGKMTEAEYFQSEEYKSTLRKADGSLRGESSKKSDKKYQSYLKGGKGGGGRDVDVGKYMHQSRQHILKPEFRRGAAATGGDDKEHTDVKVSQANMGGVAWNKLGGRDTIEGIILSTWNEAGISKAPTFTSGFRPKSHKLSKSNPRSQHIQKTAFDLRSNDLGSNAGGIFSRLMEAFGPMGIWGQHETAGVNAKNRSGEHFHFQLAAKGFSGTVNKATGFIAGEEGPERVDIVPLNDPSAKMDGINQLHNDRMASQGGTPSINVITSNQTNNSQDQSSVVMQPQLRPKEIKV